MLIVLLNVPLLRMQSSAMLLMAVFSLSYSYT